MDVLPNRALYLHACSGHYWQARKSWRSSLLALLCLLLCRDLTAQEYNYVQYGPKDGLANANVHGIAQDRDGFLWFATEGGLSRFDGSQFQNYTTADGLPSNEVFGTLTDAKGRTWILTFKNAVCYYQNGSIHNQQNDPVLARMGPFDSDIASYAEAADGSVLITTRLYQTVVLSNKNELSTISRAPDPCLTPSRKQYSLTKIIGPVYLGFEAGTRSLKLDHIRSRYISGWVRDRLDGSITYLFSDLNTFSLCNTKSDSVYTYPYSGTIGPVLIDDSLIAVFNTLGGGLSMFNIRQHRYTDRFLTDYIVHGIFRDREGNLWFSTNGSGAFKLCPGRIVSYRFGRRSLPMPVYDVKKADGSLYVGTEGDHYWQISGHDHAHPQLLDASVNKVKILRKLGQPLLLNFSSSNFLGLSYAAAGEIRLQAIKTGLRYQDTLLLSFSNSAGLYKLYHDGKIDRITTLYDHRSTCSYYKDGWYYIGTINGLYRTKPGAAQQFLGVKSPLLAKRISCFAESPDGTLWIGTYENGVVGYKNDAVTVNLTADNSGLVSNIVRCLYAADHTLWIGTLNGLCRADIRGAVPKIASTYSVDEGLSSNTINTVLEDGALLYVGTANALDIVDQSFQPPSLACNIKMNSIMVSGKARRTDSVLTLAHSDNNIQFRFSGISMQSSGHITFRYRLLGLSDGWKTTQETGLTYPALPSGHYVLQLIAVGKSGMQSRMLQQAFIIEQTLWENTGFKLLACAILLLLILFITMLYVRKVRTKERQKRAIERNLLLLEQKALRGQMNPHFIFNCMNSIQHYILNKDVVAASEYMAEFASLMRKTLEINTGETISLKNEIAYLNNYLTLEQMRFEGKLYYELTWARDIDLLKTEIPPMIIQPFIENSIQHGIRNLTGNHGLLLVHFKIEDGYLVCTVDDNGIGRAAARRLESPARPAHTSHGMNLTNNRFELLRQLSGLKFDIEVIDKKDAHGQPNGTLVVIKYPISNAQGYYR